MEEHVPFYKRGCALIGLVLSLIVLLGIGLFAWQVYGYYQALKNGERPTFVPIRNASFQLETAAKELNNRTQKPMTNMDEDDGAPYLGPQNAEKVIVAFFDYGCPYCKMASGVLRSFSAKHPEVKILFRDFAIESTHPGAREAAVTARCVWKTDPERFWLFQEAVFANQTNLNSDRLRQAMVQTGVNPDTVAQCLKEGSAEAEVTRSMSEAYDAGVWATPTFFIRGEKIEGAVPERVLTEAVFGR